MDIISMMYAEKRKRRRLERERNSPQWKLAAAAAATHKLLTAQSPQRVATNIDAHKLPRKRKRAL